MLRGRNLLAAAISSRAEVRAEREAAEQLERNGRTLAAASYHRLNAAVSNMNQGLCMFDTADRLIIANPRLAELFDLSATVLAVGTSLRAAIRGAIRRRAISAADARGLRTGLEIMPGAAPRQTLVWDLANGRALSVSFERIAGQGWLMTLEDSTERRRSEARIAHMAHHDALTLLPNRILFHQRLEAAIALAGRGNRYGILYLDLDHFKDVNDTLGHPVGDALLQDVTARLLRCAREADTVARLGGDEFAVIVSSVQHPEDVVVVAERIIAEISRPYEILGNSVLIGVSIGVALTPEDGLDPVVLLKNADLALYRAKGEGRGCYRFFEPEMDAALHARRRLELDLRRAVLEHQFELHYQPMVDVRRGRVCGFEALLRWPHPGHPTVGPKQFVPLAEEIGLIIPLGQWVLEAACAEATAWPDQIVVAVNLSPLQFRAPNLVSMIRAALDRSGLSPSRLELEITENVLLKDTADTLAALHMLRDMGVRISMDDFGTGYSSLSYLLKFPFDKVKIDRAFVRGLNATGNSDVIVRAVTGMCHDLGMATIAEGVETVQQLVVLQARNVTEMQGFLFSPAVPAHEIAALIANFDPSLLRQPNRPLTIELFAD